MKLFIACLGTETNTFSPFVTGYRTFEETYVARGGNHGATPNMFALPLVRWRELAVAKNWEVVESLCAFATPAGLTLRHVYEGYRDEILADLQAAMPVDAVLLSLHGAMVADGYEDCEGDLIAAIRRIVGPDVPIGGELDLHCHLTEQMVEAATVLVAYKEYPHTDYLARADELFALIAATLAGEVKPHMALYDCAMIGVFHTSRQPMRQFVDDMIALESQDAVLSVSLGHGFPWGDVAEMGTRVLVVTDDQPALAASLAADLGRQIFDLRAVIQPDYKSMAEAIELVRAADRGPIVLADVADNAGGGAPNDSTFLLRALLDANLNNIAVAAIWDPVTVMLAMEAGEGARLPMRIGGKVGPMSGPPLDLTVTVTKIVADATQTFGLPPDTNEWRMGASVALRTDEGAELVVNTLRTQTFNPDAFTNLGIDPTAKQALIVKSMQHFYAGFAPIAAEILYVGTPGALVTDFAQLPYQRARRTLWPIADG